MKYEERPTVIKAKELVKEFHETKDLDKFLLEFGRWSNIYVRGSNVPRIRFAEAASKELSWLKELLIK